MELIERNFKLVIEYNGINLAGWQRQKDRPSVQGRIEEALEKLTGGKVSVMGAGRTDAGVHARGQVAHFKAATRLSLGEMLRALNSILPDQISVCSIDEVPADFHARYSAKSKIYDYDIFNNRIRSALNRFFVWHIPDPLDVELMAAALTCLLGEHDFACFQSTGSSVQTTVRTMMNAEISRPDGLVRMTFEADGFLRHMVRAIVGTVVSVGRKQLTLADFEKILASKDRSQAGVSAPASGLFLREVKY